MRPNSFRIRNCPEQVPTSLRISASSPDCPESKALGNADRLLYEQKNAVRLTIVILIFSVVWARRHVLRARWLINWRNMPDGFPCGTWSGVQCDNLQILPTPRNRAHMSRLKVIPLRSFPGNSERPAPSRFPPCGKARGRRQSGGITMFRDGVFHLGIQKKTEGRDSTPDGEIWWSGGTRPLSDPLRENAPLPE